MQENVPSEESEAKVEESKPPAPAETVPTNKSEPKKRGRPAIGKRSDEAWIGRTFYVKRETDLDVEEALLQLQRQGIEIDKSELVNLLMSAWVKWQKGEDIETYISEVTPRRKS